VRAFVDQNRNRGLDRNEPFDTVRVTVPQRAPAELLIAPRDTLSARITTVAVVDSVTLRVSFDRLLDPLSPPTPADFRLVSGPDSAVVPITAVLTPAQEAAAQTAAQAAAADSARKADTTRRAPVVPPSVTGARKGADTAVVAKPSRPAPFNAVALKLGRALLPNVAYRLATTGVRSLSGRSAPSERTFTTPRPPAAAARDSAAARRVPGVRPDSARRTVPAAPARPPASAPPTTGRP
jgi:hypothetical protein